MRVKMREPLLGRVRTLDSDVTNKRLIATFQGDNIVAEREDGELRIYLLGTGDMGTVQVRDHLNALKHVQARNNAFWRRSAPSGRGTDAQAR